MIVSREGGFFIQTTTTTTLGSAVLIPSEDSLGVAATSPRQRKNGEGATLRFSLSGGGCSYTYVTLRMEGDHWRTLKVF